MIIHFDYHIHSYYSHDSLNRPKDIIKEGIRKKIDVLSITDHNTIRGSLEAKKIAKEYGILFITGIELYTNMGDIIILGLKEEIKIKDFYELVDIAHENEWITILPHPYVRHIMSDDFIKTVKNKITAIEVFNSRSFSYYNTRAFKFAKILNKPATAGSDAHLLKELGNGLNIVFVEDYTEESLYKSLRKGFIRIRAKYSNPFYHLTSALIQIPKGISRII